jgi:hypothetical protein
MNGLEVVTKAVDACDLLECSKFYGAVAAELLRQALASEGIATSNRDVYVRDLPFESDLLVLHGGAQGAFNGLLYEPAQVLCVIEVKLSGMIDVAKSLPKLRRNFDLATKAGLACCYVCMADRRAAVLTEKALGFRCFTLAYAVGYGPRLRYEDSNVWQGLLSFLRGTEGAKAPAEDSA